MSSAVLRNGAVSRLLRRHPVGDHFRSPITVRNQTHFRSPTLFASSFSSSSWWVKRVGFIGWCLGMVKSRPILAKSVTCCSICGAADFTSQMIGRCTSEEQKPYDLLRTTRMGGYGLLVLGPTLHFLFNFMSKVSPKQGIAATFKKPFMGQTLYALVMTVMFCSISSGFQGENGADIFARLSLYDFITYKSSPLHLQRSGGSHFVEKAKNFVLDKLPTVKKPEASVTDVDFKDLSRDGANYMAKISVDNPYSTPIPICEVSYTLKSATRVIASGTMADP